MVIIILYEFNVSEVMKKIVENGPQDASKKNMKALIATISASSSSSSSSSKSKKKLALVTGTTDGIGKHTARRLVEQNIDVIVHGRTQERIDKAVEEISKASSDKGKVVGAILSDLSTLEGVENLFDKVSKDVVEKEGRKLDIVVQNAGVFLPERKVNERKIELTFQINVLAPYMLNCLLWNKNSMDTNARILNVASISQTSGVQLDDLTFEKQWSDHWSYSHSKTCMKSVSFEMYLRMMKNSETVRTILTCDPGTVNTKMLLAGWGPCGVQVYDANDQFELVTNDKFTLPQNNGGYFVNRRLSQEAKSSPETRLVWETCKRETGVTFEFDV